MQGYAAHRNDATTTSDPTSYAEADALLQGRCRESRKVANNTYLKRRGDDIAVMLHATDVVTFHPDGTATLDTGGWETMTTRDRINRFSPAKVWTDRGTMYLGRWQDGKREAIRYFDGIRVDSNGQAVNAGEADDTLAKRDALNAEIMQYARDFDKALKAGDVPLPSGGDCWYCLGMNPTDPDHLIEHMREPYYVPSLLVNAYRHAGIPDAGIAISLGMYGQATFLRHDRLAAGRLRKYLRAHIMDVHI